MMAEWYQETLIPGRLCAGISHGFVYIATLIHTSETASKEFRHFLVLNVGFTFGLSILVVAVISLSSYKAGGLEANTAITTFIYAILALVNNHFSTQESPIYLLQKQNMDTEGAAAEAYETFRILQKKRMSCIEIQRRFTELKASVIEESFQSRKIFDDGNFNAIILATCIRLATVLSFNLGLVLMALEMGKLVIVTDESHMLRIIFLCWFVGGTLTIFISYKYRHYLYLVALIFGIISTVNIILLIVGIGIFIRIFLFVLTVSLLYYVLCISLPLEILGGIYLSEAFPLSKKPFSIAVTLTVEYLVHILLTFFIMENMMISFWFVTSLSLIGLGFKLFWCVPRDTHQMALPQSARAFASASAREWYTRANDNSRCP